MAFRLLQSPWLEIITYRNNYSLAKPWRKSSLNRLKRRTVLCHFHWKDLHCKFSLRHRTTGNGPARLREAGNMMFLHPPTFSLCVPPPLSLSHIHTWAGTHARARISIFFFLSSFVCLCFGGVGGGGVGVGVGGGGRLIKGGWTPEEDLVVPVRMIRSRLRAGDCVWSLVSDPFIASAYTDLASASRMFSDNNNNGSRRRFTPPTFIDGLWQWRHV